MNNYKRRDFLRLGTGLLGGLALGAGACNNSSDTKTTEADSSKADINASTASALGAFGIQMYTLRDDYPKDVKGVLKKVADMGYTQIEGYEGEKGLFWGMTNTEFKTYCDSLGITMVSSHCDTSKNFEKKAAESAAIGMKYLFYPYEGRDLKMDDYKKMAEDFNKKGAICKQNGIRFGFHNHDMSFIPINGEMPQDVLMANTDADLVDYEMDIYWVVTAGQDPEAWLKKYPNRFRACHIKDRSKTPDKDNGKNSVNLGTGVIDFRKILRTARDNGMQYYIVEQEFYPSGTPLEAAKADADYMKAFKC
jgi:sugar phosphate isomerase/epimerase